MRWWVVSMFAAVVYAAEPVMAANAAITVAAPFARATAPTATAGAVYGNLMGGANDDVLLSATSAACTRVEIHDHLRGDDGVLRMRPIERLAVLAGATVELAPGGKHLMLMELRQPLRQGDTVTVELRFERAGVISVAVPVGEPGALKAPGALTAPDALTAPASDSAQAPCCH